MSSGSVTTWLHLLQAGNEIAAQELWERYFVQLTHLARHRLQGLPLRAVDEEDVALSAFACFCNDVRHGRFPQLGDRDNLWRLLVVITARKALDVIRRERAQKRGRGVELESDIELAEVIATEPSPAFVAEVTETCQYLLNQLPDSDLRSIAVWKMEGFGNDEIAERLGCVPRTIERRLRVIRTLWTEEVA